MAALTRSATDVQPFDGAATSTLGCTPNMATGMKSRAGSYGRLLCRAAYEPCEAVKRKSV